MADAITPPESVSRVIIYVLESVGSHLQSPIEYSAIGRALNLLAWIAAYGIVAIFAWRYFAEPLRLYQNEKALGPDKYRPARQISIIHGAPMFNRRFARLCFVAICWFLLILVFSIPSLYPHVKVDPTAEGFSRLKQELLVTYPQILCSLMIVGILPWTLPEAISLGKMRAYIQSKASFPNTLQRLAEELYTKNLLVTLPEDQGLINHLCGLHSGLTQTHFELDAHTFDNKFAKLCLYLHDLKNLENADQSGPDKSLAFYLTQLHAEHASINAAFQRLEPLRPLIGQPDTKLAQGIEETLDDLLKDCCWLIAQVYLSASGTRNSAIKRIRERFKTAIQFHDDPEPVGTIVLICSMMFFVAFFIVFFVAIFLTHPADINASPWNCVLIIGVVTTLFFLPVYSVSLLKDFAKSSWPYRSRITSRMFHWYLGSTLLAAAVGSAVIAVSIYLLRDRWGLTVGIPQSLGFSTVTGAIGFFMAIAIDASREHWTRENTHRRILSVSCKRILPASFIMGLVCTWIAFSLLYNRPALFESFSLKDVIMTVLFTLAVGLTAPFLYGLMKFRNRFDRLADERFYILKQDLRFLYKDGVFSFVNADRVWREHLGRFSKRQLRVLREMEIIDQSGGLRPAVEEFLRKNRGLHVVTPPLVSEVNAKSPISIR